MRFERVVRRRRRARASTASPAAVASGFPDSVPAWYTGPSGASSSMIAARPPTAASGRPPPIDLAEDREVGRDAEAALRAAEADAEAGDHLVEHEQRAVRGAALAQRRRGSRRRGGDEAHVGGDRLDEDRREVGAVLGERGVERGEVVVGHDDRVGDRARR